MPGRTFPDCYCQCLHSCGEPLATHISTGDPSTLAGSFGSVSCGVPAPFLWVLVGAQFCLRLESCCGNTIIKSHWPSRSDSLGIPSPFVRSPGWKAWHGFPKLHHSERTSLVLLFSSLWVTHPLGIGFDFNLTAPLLPYCCGFFFWRGVSFFGGSSFLLSVVVQQLVAVLVLSQEGMSTCPLLRHLEREAQYFFLLH